VSNALQQQQDASKEASVRLSVSKALEQQDNSASAGNRKRKDKAPTDSGGDVWVGL